MQNDTMSVAGPSRMPPVTPRGFGYQIPPGLDLPPATPFWVAVAYWGWLLGRPFGCRDVEAAFRVETVRAANVMSVIRARHCADLHLSVHYEPIPGGGRRRLLVIETAPPFPGGRSGCRQKQGVSVRGGFLEEIQTALKGRAGPAMADRIGTKSAGSQPAEHKPTENLNKENTPRE